MSIMLKSYHLVIAMFAFAVPALVPAAPAADQPQAAAPLTLWVYLGTYTHGASKGIYLGHLDLASGKLERVELAGEAKSPSFVALHPTRPLLYAVNEVWGPVTKDARNVTAFAIAPKTGKLTLLNQESSGGPGPAHLTVDRSGRCVLVGNYGGGSVACLPIQADGKLAAATSFIQHRGSGGDPKRQQGPHAHSVNMDAANRFAIVADLGLDKLLVYRLDPAVGKLTPNDPPSADMAPGAGPRHFAFHPNGRWAYAINELNCTVTAMKYDAERGTFQILESVPTLPAGVRGPGNSTAEVQVHPSGKFLYGSNRGHNSIAIFAIEAETGKLRVVGHESTQGKTPRNFGIDPTGRYLLAANQDSGNIVVFRIDAETGKLQATGSEVKLAMPVCVKFLCPLE